MVMSKLAMAEPVAIDDSGPLAADLNRALKLGARAFILTPRAQNPSGAALDSRRAAELRRVLSAFPEVVLIERPMVTARKIGARIFMMSVTGALVT